MIFYKCSAKAIVEHFQAAATFLQNYPDMVQKLVADALQLVGEGLFQEHTVGEFLFGYTITYQKMINEITEKLIHKRVFQYDGFGMFYGVSYGLTF